MLAVSRSAWALLRRQAPLASARWRECHGRPGSRCRPSRRRGSGSYRTGQKYTVNARKQYHVLCRGSPPRAAQRPPGCECTSLSGSASAVCWCCLLKTSHDASRCRRATSSWISCFLVFLVSCIGAVALLLTRESTTKRTHRGISLPISLEPI